MRILALDTSLDACAVAVVEDARTLAVRLETMARGHQERLAPLTGQVLTAAALRVADLDRIAVTVGPGSFTGLRVGLAFAKGLSLAAGKPLVGVGVLAALIAAVDPTTLVAAVVDARNGRVHLQIGDGEPCACLDAEAAARIDAAGATVLTGPAAPRLAALLGAMRQVAHVAPDVAVVARLGARAPTTSGASLLYLRAPDARTLAERALACS